MISSKKIKKGQVQGTDLSYTPSPTNGIVTSDTGTDATLPLADGTNAGLISPAEKTKLTGIAENANNYVHPNHSGDVTSVGDGVQTIANEAVTNAKFRNSTAHTVVGRAGAGNGSVADIGLSNNTILGRQGSGSVQGLSVSEVQEMLVVNNVDNTSDIDKPISTAQQAALDAKLDKAELTRTPTLGEIDTETIFSDRVVILDVGSTDTTVTILTALNNVLFKKKGSGIVTFVSDAGRTLRTLTNNLNVLTADGGMALLFADGTTDNLYINDGEQPSLLRSGYRKGVILDTDFTLGGGVQTATVGLSEAYPDASYDIWLTFYRASGALFSYHYVIPEASVTSTGFQLILNTGSAVTGLKIKYQTFRDE